MREESSRRRLLGIGAAAGASVFFEPGRFAEELLRTPTITEGPFYPDQLPLDTDNDLLVLNDAITPALGKITHVSGRVLSRSGAPVANAFVELWQVDVHGSYLHKGGRVDAKWDGNFQGYGRFMTDRKGRYHFRTIQPVPYIAGRTRRAPHLHFAVSKNGRRLLTTQMMTNGHPQNAQDGVFRAVRDPLQRETVLADYLPVPGSKIGELQVEWDIVLGHTLVEDEDGVLGVSKSRRAGARGSEGPRHRFDSKTPAIDRYMSLDADGDGKLAEKELSSRMQSLLRRADRDRDGFATREELLRLLGQKRV